MVARQRGWLLACDDRDATLVARSEGVRAITTVAILMACVQEAVISANAAAELLGEMIDVHGRRLPRLSAYDLG